MSIMLSIALVRASDGSVDKDATLDACDAAIDKFVAERETEEATIAEAVGALFAEHKSASLNMPYVCNETLRRLNVQPSNYKQLNDRVAQYVRDHSQGAKLEDGTWERPLGTFRITKGKGGGVTLVADIVAKPAATK